MPKETADKTAEIPAEEATEKAPSQDETVPRADLDKLKSDFESYKEESEGRLESLQDSLDSALEEISLRGQTPEAETEEEEEMGEGEEGTETVLEEQPKGKKAKPTEAEEAEEPQAPESSVESEIESAIKEDQQFREEILMREEMRDLRDELRVAMAKYPNADENEVLLAIEDGDFEGRPDQVEALARASQEERLASKEEILQSAKESAKEEIQQDLVKEKEGDISVPQSEGTPSAPKAPTEAESKKGIGAPGTYDEDAEWTQAREAAKAEGEGA